MPATIRHWISASPAMAIASFRFMAAVWPRMKVFSPACAQPSAARSLRASASRATARCGDRGRGHPTASRLRTGAAGGRQAYRDAYIAALRTEPGRTDTCKLFLSGSMAAKVASVTIRDAVSPHAPPAQAKGELTSTGAALRLALPESALPGDCDWVLDLIGEPAVRKRRDEDHDGVTLRVRRCTAALNHPCGPVDGSGAGAKPCSTLNTSL